ncbi:hypothetical protein EAF04_007020 [Stromatinia cepivora]|nr:hypothetical protein EAF04_007020 [Stromatinia cepivora]
MPLLNKLLHKEDQEKFLEKDIPSVRIEQSFSQSPSSPLAKVSEAPPGYTATNATDGAAEEDLSAAFANLKISPSSIPAFPDPDLCLAHLKLLKTFHNLREDVGYTDGIFGLWDARCELPIVEDRNKALVVMREKRWALYIARAVERFEDWWLKVLCEQENATRLRENDMKINSNFMDFPKHGVAKTWSTSLLPPKDVLMVWHSLMLNPRNYLEDCIRFGLKDLWATGMPWHAVNAAIDTNFNYQVPEAAKERFTNATGHHWSNAKDHFAKALNCPRCAQALKIPWTTCATNEKPSLKEIMEMNGAGYGDQGLSYICHRCGGEINHDLLRVAKFRREVENLIMRGYPLGGTILSPATGIPEAAETRNPQGHENTFPNRMITIELKVKMLDLIDKNPNSKPAMTDVRDLIEATIKDRSAIRRINSRTGILLRAERIAVRKMMSRYWENSSIFALELGGAVIRQSIFVDKMANLDWLHSPVAGKTMTRLLTKYRRFIDIMRLHPKDVCVPTLDVDLAWHTHQLSPKQYYDYTFSQCFKFIDHDDKMEEDALSTAFEWTSKTYEKLYRQVYSECTCWYCEAIRSKHIDSSSGFFGTSKHEKVLDSFYTSGAAKQCDPNNSAHISAHSAVRIEESEIRASVLDRLSRKNKSEMNRAYDKARHRAQQKGRTIPPRDDYYCMAWGYPYMMYGPYMSPIYVGAPVYYAGDPCVMPVGVGMAGACAAGSCGGGVAAGGCGGAGGWAEGVVGVDVRVVQWVAQQEALEGEEAGVVEVGVAEEEEVVVVAGVADVK